MSNELFEQWAIDPKGGGWATNPTVGGYDYFASVQWKQEQAAFTAGIQAERQRLQKLVEARLAEINKYAAFHPQALQPLARLQAAKELRLVASWLTAGSPTTPEPDKTETDKTL